MDHLLERADRLLADTWALRLEQRARLSQARSAASQVRAIMAMVRNERFRAGCLRQETADTVRVSRESLADIGGGRSDCSNRQVRNRWPIFLATSSCQFRLISWRRFASAIAASARASSVAVSCMAQDKLTWIRLVPRESALTSAAGPKRTCRVVGLLTMLDVPGRTQTHKRRLPEQPPLALQRLV